ncbi:MAG: hypothetical protein WC492_00270 [Candidatus Micrarchaeia archaeon]
MFVYQLRVYPSAKEGYGKQSSSETDASLQNSSLQYNNYLLIMQGYGNYYNRKNIIENKGELLPLSSNIKNKLTSQGESLSTKLTDEDGISALSSVNVTYARDSAPGSQDIGYSAQPSVIGIRSIAKKFKSGAQESESLSGSAQMMLNMYASIVELSLEGNVQETNKEAIMEFVRENLKIAFLTIQEDIKNNKKSTLDAKAIFGNPSFVTGDLAKDGYVWSALKTFGVEDKNINNIRTSFINIVSGNPKSGFGDFITTLFPTATMDALPQSSLSTKAGISQSAIDNYTKLSYTQNISLLNSLKNDFVRRVFGESFAEKVSAYLYYSLQKNELSDKNAIKKAVGEIDAHISLLNDVFVNCIWKNEDNFLKSHPAAELERQKSYYSKALDAASDRGMAQIGLKTSVQGRINELRQIKEGLQSRDLAEKNNALNEFALFKARYTICGKYCEEESQGSDKKIQTPENYAKTVAKIDLEPQDVPGYYATTLALNPLGRNLVSIPKEGANIMSIELKVDENSSTTHLSPGSKGGVAVTSQSVYEVNLSDKSIITPDMEILAAKAYDFLKEINPGKTITSSIENNTIRLAISEKKVYVSLEKANLHYSMFYVPGTLSGSTPVPVPVYEVGLEAKSRSSGREVVKNGSYFDLELGYGVHDYDNLAKDEKDPLSIYGEKNIHGENRGNRIEATKGLKYADYKFNVGVSSEEGYLTSTYTTSIAPKAAGASCAAKAKEFIDSGGAITTANIQNFFDNQAVDDLIKIHYGRMYPSLETWYPSGETPKVYDSKAMLEKYEGSLSAGKVKYDLYVTFLQKLYESLPAGADRDVVLKVQGTGSDKKISGLLYDAMIDEQGIYLDRFMRDQAGYQFTVGRVMRLLDSLSLRVFESGAYAKTRQNLWVGIPGTEIGQNGELEMKLAYIPAYGSMNNGWMRESSFGVSTPLPGVSGTYLNLQNSEAFALELMWSTFLYASEETSLKGRVKLWGMVSLPNTEILPNDAGIVKFADNCKNYWDGFMSGNLTFDQARAKLKDELKLLREAIKNSYSQDKTTLEAIDNLIGKEGQTTSGLLYETEDAGHVQTERTLLALVRGKDESELGWIYEHYNGGKTGASYISASTFVNELSEYSGVTSFAKAIPAGNFSLEFELDGKISKNMPYNVTLKTYPLTPFIVKTLMESLASDRNLFGGISAKDKVKGLYERYGDMLEPKWPPTIIDASVGYSLPLIKNNLYANFGIAANFNVFSIDMEGASINADLSTPGSNLRFIYSLEKSFFKATPYTPMIGAGLQVSVNEIAHHFADVKIPWNADIKGEILYSRDLPEHDFSLPHMETLGWRAIFSMPVVPFGEDRAGKNAYLFTSESMPAFKVQMRKLSASELSENEMKRIENLKDGQTYGFELGGDSFVVRRKGDTLNLYEKRKDYGKKAAYGLDDWRVPTSKQSISQSYSGDYKDFLLSNLTSDEQKEVESLRVPLANNSYYNPRASASSGSESWLNLEEMVNYMLEKRSLLSALSNEEREFLKNRQISGTFWYSHPQTGVQVDVGQMVSYLHNTKFNNNLLSLLSPQELEGLNSRRSMVSSNTNPLFYFEKENGGYETLNLRDAILRTVETNIKEQKTNALIRLAQSAPEYGG